MSLIKFELKEDHLKLLRYLEWSLDDSSDYIVSKPNIITDDDEIISYVSPFGGDNLIQDIGVIIYGKSENFIDKLMDESSNFGDVLYSEEQKKYMLDLFTDLPRALEVCLFTQSFVVGHYKSKYHLRNWTRYRPK
jgi:hypothetical protein